MNATKDRETALVPDRHRSSVSPLGAGVFVVAIALSCGGTSGGSILSASGNDASAAPATGGPGSPSFAGQGSDAGACSGNAQGCLCAKAGETAACWTGPANMRNVGACHDGTAQCVMMGEFAQWGACTGQQLSCGGTGGGGQEDSGGTGSGGGGNEDSGGPGTGGEGGEPPGCQCVPGAIIWCDADCTSNIYCSATSQKTCQPDGSWSPCRETGQGVPFGSCKHVGLGCQGCNGGIGYYTGDCTQALNCGGNAPYCQNLNYSDSGSFVNGVGSGEATCTCN